MSKEYGMDPFNDSYDWQQKKKEGWRDASKTSWASIQPELQTTQEEEARPDLSNSVRSRLEQIWIYTQNQKAQNPNYRADFFERSLQSAIGKSLITAAEAIVSGYIRQPEIKDPFPAQTRRSAATSRSLVLSR